LNAEVEPVTLVLQSLGGFFALHIIAWLLSENRRVVSWRTVLSGMLLTVGLAVLLLKVPGAQELFSLLNTAVNAIERATQAGTSFVFGYIGGGPTPFEMKNPNASFVLAFRALPIVLIISAITSLLFYWRILPILVRAFAWLLQRVMGLGGAVGLSSAANVFVGMVEAPLFVRPYIERMTRSELFILMTCGMATVAGTVMVLYASVLATAIPGALGHILVASVICTPAAIVISVLMVPPSTYSLTSVQTSVAEIAPSEARSTMDAITRGTIDGVGLLINITAMLVVLVALVYLANEILSLLPNIGDAPLTLQRMLGVIMAPLVWLTGIPWSEASAAGALMGTKTVLNELIAYLDLARLDPAAMSQRSRVIMLYSMCGFANLGSLGIMIGGLATMAPNRRDEIVSLGAKTLISGTLATLVAGSVVGFLY
jgi:concentrative nucleoside transporter, CNT family